MPSATIAFKGHSATATWPAGTSPDAVNSLLTHVQGQMLSMYGPDGDAAQTMGNALQDGAHNSMMGLGATANALSTAAADTIGPGMLSRGAADVGHFLTSNAPAAPVGYAPSGPRVGQDIQSGNWSALPGDLTRGAIESAPDIGAALAVGIPTDGLGAGAYMAARSLGNTADSRAADNGRTTPTLGDIAGALPSTVAQGVLGDVGMGGAAAGIASPLLRAAAKVGIAGAAGAAGDQAVQLGASVGTTQGAQDNPWQSLGAGLASGADRVASLAPGLASAATRATADNIRSRGIDLSPDQAASVQRVSGALQSTTAASPGLTPKGAAAAVASGYAGKLSGMIRDWRGAGHIDANDAAELRGALSAPQGYLASTLAGLTVPDHEATAFLNGAQDLSTLGTMTAPARTVGPLQAAGSAIGKFGGAGAALMHGSPLEALAALGVGESVGGKIGGKIGAIGDHVLGLNTAPGGLQRLAAARVLLKSGVAPSSIVSNMPTLDAIRTTYADARGALDPVGSAAQSAIDKAAARNQIRLAMEGLQPGSADSTANAAAMNAASRGADAIRRLAEGPAAADADRASLGIPPDPVPVNQPIPAGVSPTGPTAAPVPTLPPLRIDTPASVAAAVGQDATAPGADAEAVGTPPAGPVGVPQLPAGALTAPQATAGAPTVLPTPAASVGSPVGGLSPARKYLAAGNPHVTGPVLDAGLAAAVQAGAISPEVAQTMFHPSNPVPIPPEVAPHLAKAVRPFVLSQLPLSQGGTADLPGGAAGRLGAASAATMADPTVSRPLAYQIAAREYHASAAAAAASAREDSTLRAVGLADAVAQTIDAVRMTKGRQAKQDTARALLVSISDPAVRELVSQRFPAWLLDHGPAR